MSPYSFPTQEFKIHLFNFRVSIRWTQTCPTSEWPGRGLAIPFRPPIGKTQHEKRCRVNLAPRPPKSLPDPQAAEATRDTLSREKRSWGDQLLSAFHQVPCYDAPIPLSEYFIDNITCIINNLVNHLSQFVIELESYSSLYEKPLLTKLCDMQKAIAPQLQAFDSFTP